MADSKRMLQGLIRHMRCDATNSNYAEYCITFQSVDGLVHVSNLKKRLISMFVNSFEYVNV